MTVWNSARMLTIGMDVWTQMIVWNACKQMNAQKSIEWTAWQSEGKKEQELKGGGYPGKLIEMYWWNNGLVGMKMEDADKSWVGNQCREQVVV